MFGKATAIIAAAACATIVVIVVPALSPAMTASAATNNASIHSGLNADSVPGPQTSRSACADNWPYYDAACLHDSRRPDGRARAVRIVSTDRLPPLGIETAAR